MKFDICINEHKYIVEIDEKKAVILDKLSSQKKEEIDDSLDIPDFDFSEDVCSESTSVVAPLFGTVIAVNISKGQTVKKGDRLIVIESMKMENEIVADKDGIISEVLVDIGDAVEKNQVVMYLE